MPYLTGHVLDYGCGVGWLAHHIPADKYVGYDSDFDAIVEASSLHPGHRFTASLDDLRGETFDTCVLMAVIEHVHKPGKLLGDLRRFTPDGRLIVTTPHPAYEWVHSLGARLGLFSEHAAEDHERLLDKGALEALFQEAGFKFVHYRRFFGGGNQLAVGGTASRSVANRQLQ